MDRRDFLKTGGAVVATGAAVVAPAGAAEPGPAVAPAILPGAKAITLATTWAPQGPGAAHERLARRIEMATDGRYRIEVGAGADPDLVYGPAGRPADPAFAFFAGLPFGQGLDARAQQTWLAVGGGQTLWDDLAAERGFKPLVAGHTGAGGGVWSTARLEQVSDLAGVTVGVQDGICADAVRALGAVPVAIDPGDVKAALAEGRVDAADWLAPHAATDLQPLAQRLYRPGFKRDGVVLSLEVGLSLWERMSAADQAILEACAAEEHRLSLAEAYAHALLAAPAETPAKWPVRLGFSAELSRALEAAARDAVAGLARSSDVARRIHDSHQAFRRMLGGGATA